MKDGVTPQALYWVFDRYSKLTGTNLSSVSSTASDVVALARATPISGATAPEIRVLVGRFVSNLLSAPAAAKNIAIQIHGLPDNTCPAVTMERIPYQGPAQTSLAVAQPLAAPQLIATYLMALTSGSLTLHLPQFADRDAYYIRISAQ